uniref:Non-specific lipid transfer protein GPI-anchored 1-like n=1 Tax=Nicotiana tabacum TaxID=4097 RepID=A0A1S3XQV0_TOBAC|nr:PREDICTED: non-specific lipid transfer protein GPI-anchored 1-like [Nicotiana tabacum]
MSYLHFLVVEDKLLQLPSACKLANASISNCPELLNIPSTSPDYAIFTNASTASKTPVATPAGASSSSSPDTTKDSSNGFKNGPQLSIFGTAMAAAVVAVILSVIPRGATSVLMYVGNYVVWICLAGTRLNFASFSSGFEKVICAGVSRLFKTQIAPYWILF